MVEACSCDLMEGGYVIQYGKRGKRGKRGIPRSFKTVSKMTSLASKCSVQTCRPMVVVRDWAGRAQWRSGFDIIDTGSSVRSITDHAYARYFQQHISDT
jgi:hypothetical protein